MRALQGACETHTCARLLAHLRIAAFDRCSSCGRMQRLQRTRRPNEASKSDRVGTRHTDQHFLVTTGAICESDEDASRDARVAHDRRKALKTHLTKCAPRSVSSVIKDKNRHVHCADKCDKCRVMQLDFLQQLLSFWPRAQATPTRAERVRCSARDVCGCVCC